MRLRLSLWIHPLRSTITLSDNFFFSRSLSVYGDIFCHLHITLMRFEVFLYHCLVPVPGAYTSLPIILGVFFLGLLFLRLSLDHTFAPSAMATSRSTSCSPLPVPTNSSPTFDLSAFSSSKTENYYTIQERALRQSSGSGLKHKNYFDMNGKRNQKKKDHVSSSSSDNSSGDDSFV
jgi:hypothetical protein